MSMSRIHLTLFALAATAAGCSKSGGDGKGEPAGSGGTAAPAAPAGLTAEAATLAITGFSVEAQVPKGWTKAEFGGGFLYSAPGKSLFPSTFFITPGCQGNCAKIADNVAGFVETQKKQHEASGYKVTVVSQGALPEGGREFRLGVTGSSDFVQVVAVHHRDGWDQAVTCSASLLKDDRAHADAFAGWCRALKITKK
jgi:hypothetical protein